MKITAEDLEQILVVMLDNNLSEAIHDLEDDDSSQGRKVEIRTFREAGVLTNDDGLVLRVGNREFQITIIRSK